MRKVIAVAAVALLAGGVLMAQEGGGRGMPAPAGPAPTCPASGYGAQAYYAGFGQNGGDGQTAYEIASPCIGKDVREVAESIGMGRNKLMGVKSVIGVQFRVRRNDGRRRRDVEAGQRRVPDRLLHPGDARDAEGDEGQRPAAERNPCVCGSIRAGTRRRKAAARRPPPTRSTIACRSSSSPRLARCGR